MRPFLLGGQELYGVKERWNSRLLILSFWHRCFEWSGQLREVLIHSLYKDNEARCWTFEMCLLQKAPFPNSHWLTFIDVSTLWPTYKIIYK